MYQSTLYLLFLTTPQTVWSSLGKRNIKIPSVPEEREGEEGKELIGSTRR